MMKALVSNLSFAEVLHKKIQLYMSSYILPRFDPERIHWIFSLSGGKDSFTMAESIHEWYTSRQLRLTATGLFINQWEDPFREHFHASLPWLDVEIVDASHTSGHLSRAPGSRQAPCRQCSDIRHSCTDEFLESHKTGGFVNIVCRGLHLSDMTISILWRMLYGLEPIDDLDRGRKGRPLIELFDGHYLAKPLCFVREYECQQYAEERNYYAVHCNCPGLRYPSRRDIVEESARLYYTGTLWEFDVPFVAEYCSRILGLDNVSELRNLSAPGIEKKRALIPDGFFDFAYAHFKSIKHTCGTVPGAALDAVVNNFFDKAERSDAFQITHFLSNAVLRTRETDFSKRMLATLGPYWMAVCLTDRTREECFKLQKERFGYFPDRLWGQVISLLLRFYESGYR